MPNVCREKLLEPFQPHHACEADLGLEHAGAAIFACIDRDKEIRVADDRFGGEANAASADHHARSRQTPAFDDSIGIGKQNQA